MHVVHSPRETLRLVVDMIPEKYLMNAIDVLEDFLEPDEETQQAIDDVLHDRNLLGPFYSVEEMNAALLSDASDEELMKDAVSNQNVKAV